MTTAVLDPDGKVTIAGWVNGYPGDFGVTRLVWPDPHAYRF